MHTTRARQAVADPAALAATIASQHVADAVEILNALPPDTVAGILASLPREQCIEIFEYPQYAGAAEVIQRLPTRHAAAVLGAIPADRAAAIMRELNERARSHLLSLLDPETHYGEHWRLVALTVGTALVAIVTFGSLVGAILPFTLKALNFDPATASAPFVATLVDVSGIMIYFSIALLFLTGTLL